jgi:hypothetical protein
MMTSMRLPTRPIRSRVIYIAPRLRPSDHACPDGLLFLFAHDRSFDLKTKPNQVPFVNQAACAHAYPLAYRDHLYCPRLGYLISAFSAERVSMTRSRFVTYRC